MKFELSEALIDQILFSMEDQDLAHFIDTEIGLVVGADELELGAEDDRYESIPEWISADGFRLMERFAASLKNPLVREELSNALDRGRGVFRAFKNTLSVRPEVEKLWFSYKDKAMRRAIVDWYNGLCQEWGIKRIGLEPEETVDLVLEDFLFRDALTDDAEAILQLYELSRGGTEPSLTIQGASCLVVETARGDLAGFAMLLQNRDELVLKALDVHPEYRGLGIGEALLSQTLEKYANSGFSSIKIDLPSTSEAFSRVLLREGFKPYETRYRLDFSED
ncbi:hypothetical protein MASR2M78_09130 [Treponema sp.]